MTICKFSLLLQIIFFSILLGCNNDRQQETNSQIKSNQGVSSDTLDLIYNGPKGFVLEYFPREVIQAARISDCEIIDQDSISDRVVRKIKFDQNGNIIKDQNNFFSYWFEGTVRGSYQYVYDSTNSLLKMTGIAEQDNNDSIMTIWNYNKNRLLYSRDNHEFAKKLKPGADGHLPVPNDFEKYPTWNKLETYKYSHSSNNVTIETIFEDKITKKENYILQFDSLNRLKTIKKYEDTSFVESTDYSYHPNSITGNLKRKMNNGKEWRYNSKAVIDDKMNQTGKILFKDDGTGDVKMLTTYNQDGTISSIKYNNTNQIFKYSYY